MLVVTGIVELIITILHTKKQKMSTDLIEDATVKTAVSAWTFPALTTVFSNWQLRIDLNK